MSGTFEVSQESKQFKVVDVSRLGQKLKLSSTTRIKLNEKKAFEILELGEFPGDRPLREGHVEYLQDAMRRGTFRPELVKIITTKCAETGVVYRMNGQHCCWAIARFGKPIEYEVDLVHYNAATMDDVRMLYASIDRGSPRTKGNVITAYLQGTAEFMEVKPKTLKVLPAGYAMYRWESKHERRRHDGDALALLLRIEDNELVSKVCSFLDQLKPIDHGHMFRAPVVAALCYTFARARERSQEFWTAVASGEGFSAGDPRNKLRTALLQYTVGQGPGGRNDRRRISSESMLRICLHAWNAWMRDERPSYLKASDSGKRPVVAARASVGSASEPG